MTDQKRKMRPVKAWAIVGKLSGNMVNDAYRLRSSARLHRSGLSFPEHYRIARVRITEVRK